MDRHGVVETANPAAERIFGYGSWELIGADFSKLMPLLWRVEDSAFNENATGRPIVDERREAQGVRKDGSIVPIEVAISEALSGTVFTAIIRDISQRKQLEREITEIAGAEQRRIGQELHDGVSQELTGLRMMASAAKDRMGKDPDSAEGLLRHVVDGLQRVQNHVRQISHGLIPVDLDAAGLRAALTDLASRTSQQTGVSCSFQCSQRVFVNDALTATNLYTIAQEAINNALRHAKPTHITIDLNGQSEALVLSIDDDGLGYSEGGGHHEGVGIRLMRHRASLIGGVLQIGPGRERGTFVRCVVPDWRRLNLFM
jgi:PAS domain S-box-containing protein